MSGDFAHKVSCLFIKAHRELDDALADRRFVDVKFVHEYLDAIKGALLKQAAEWDAHIEQREARKRALSGAKDMPTSKDQADALKARVAANINRQRMTE